MATAAPAVTNSCTVARPMSRAPPVTRATLPRRSICILDSFDGEVAGPLVGASAHRDGASRVIRRGAVPHHDSPAQIVVAGDFNDACFSRAAEHAHISNDAARLLGPFLR